MFTLDKIYKIHAKVFGENEIILMLLYSDFVVVFNNILAFLSNCL